MHSILKYKDIHKKSDDISFSTQTYSIDNIFYTFQKWKFTVSQQSSKPIENQKKKFIDKLKQNHI